jgi:hypothetical protein
VLHVLTEIGLHGIKKNLLFVRFCVSIWRHLVNLVHMNDELVNSSEILKYAIQQFRLHQGRQLIRQKLKIERPLLCSDLMEMVVQFNKFMIAC